MRGRKYQIPADKESKSQGGSIFKTQTYYTSNEPQKIGEHVYYCLVFVLIMYKKQDQKNFNSYDLNRGRIFFF